MEHLWTQFLDFLSQIITPSWNDLLQYLPLVFVGLVVLTLALVVWTWTRNAALNQPRVRPPMPTSPPAGVHLPGPSPWPFVAPIGGLFIALSLALGGGPLPVNPVLFTIGVVFAVIGIVGWYMDAGREWRRVAVGGHAVAELAPIEAATALPAPEPPPGVHLPGPSPWPFFAPLALMFIFAGLVFNLVLVLGGIVMGLIAAAGWYRDANHEYVAVEAGHLPEPATRDPAKVFPKRLVPIYLGIAAATVALTLAPYLLSLLPHAGAGTSGPQQTPTAVPIISATTVTNFDQSAVVVPAATPLKMTFDNQQAGVPHNVEIFDATGKRIFNGEVITGPRKIVYDIPPLPAGTYTFQCVVHAPMKGTLTSK